MAFEEQTDKDSFDNDDEFLSAIHSASQADDDAGDAGEGEGEGEDEGEEGNASDADDVVDTDDDADVAGTESDADAAEAEGDADTDGKPAPQEKFETFKVKAYGKDHEITTQAQRDELISKGLDYSRKTQQLAQQRKAYKAFESELERDPDLNQAVELLLDAPTLRKATLALAERLKKGNKIHPAEIEASRYKREHSMREAEEAERDAEERGQRGRELVEKDLQRIQDEGHDASQGTPLFEELKKIYAAKRATSLWDAFVLYRAENNLQSPSTSKGNKRAQQERIRSAMTPRAGSRAPSNNKPKSDEDFLRQIRKLEQG